MSDPFAFELELPGAYIDEVVVETSGSANPILFNRGPEPDEADVPADTTIQFDLTCLHLTALVDDASVYLDGTLAATLATGLFGLVWEFQSGFSGTGEEIFPGVWRVVIATHPDDFESETEHEVRVVATSDSFGSLDETYSFTIADLAAPALTAQAIALSRVRVTFNEAVEASDAAAANDALNPANWTLSRYGDYLTPLVSATVTSVEAVSATEVDLITDIPLTPGGTYHAIVANVEDLAGNPVESPLDEAEFTGWVPPAPAGRSFDLYTKLPALNRQEDETRDLYRFIACLQEVLNLQLFDIDLFTDILDPDLADEAYVDAMLADLGNPFAFDLALIDKRRLVQLLVDMYRLKGTGVGIQRVALFFLGIELEVDAYTADPDGWVLGESELGYDTRLAPSSRYQRYSFTLRVFAALTAVQTSQLTQIVDLMKPGHTHLVGILLDQRLEPTGIASAEAFGTATVS